MVNKKITGYVHTLLSIDKGIDCVSGFVLSCILRKILLLVTRILGACGGKCNLVCVCNVIIGVSVGKFRGGKSTSFIF